MFVYYSRSKLHFEQVPLEKIVSSTGTPAYVYSRSRIRENLRLFENAFRRIPHLTCFAVKANSNLSVLKVLARLGVGADIVSGGELARVRRAGLHPDKIVFAGVGKSREEIRDAAKFGIRAFNAESWSEIELLDAVGKELGRILSVTLRVNPGVEPDTHRHVATGVLGSKFGIPLEDAAQVWRRAGRLKHIQLVGLHMHIGSQILKISPFVTALKKLLALVRTIESQGSKVSLLDLGGGYGISYRSKEKAIDIEALGHEYTRLLRSFDGTVLFEPGRFIVGNAGVLITRILHIKKSSGKNFAICDAGMNDLIRPALYDAWHEIIPITKGQSRQRVLYDVVGSLCEEGDYLGRARRLPRLSQGELLAVLNAGAYGFTMSSNYNSRPRACEVIVSGKKWQVARKRETVEELMRGEQV
jgi:diaminopimelate decarboxylase